MAVAIKASNLSKAYQIGEFSTGTLSQDIERAWYRLRGKEDPFLRLGEANDRTKKGTGNIVWSLKDINFEIEQGDAIGIIGRNGAGKSTLLKILSRVTSPTTGTVKVKGRIASLLEVGTGFHPELTGRENIYLNGAILGMRKQEIKQKFDEIVDFSGVERYIDTPVKRYSSGMYVRLAFGVAAHLESEILIVDEVLAVGDAEFQSKCLGKMKDVSANDGRTILFVSHNMTAIQNLCRNGIFMNSGKIVFSGKIDKTLNEYIHSGNTDLETFSAPDDENRPIQILYAAVTNESSDPKVEFVFGEPIFVNFKIKNVSEERNVRYNIALLDVLDRVIMVDSHYVAPKNGYKSFTVTLPQNLLTPNQYKIALSIDIPSVKLIEMMDQKFSFEIINKGSGIGAKGDTDYGFLMPSFTWIDK